VLQRWEEAFGHRWFKAQKKTYTFYQLSDSEFWRNISAVIDRNMLHVPSELPTKRLLIFYYLRAYAEPIFLLIKKAEIPSLLHWIHKLIGSGIAQSV
jgi:hypothetical protein